MPIAHKNICASIMMRSYLFVSRLLLLIVAVVTSGVSSNEKSKTHLRDLQPEDGSITVPDWGYPSSNGDPALGGTLGVDFAYQSAGYDFERGATGISYYIRAFDMFPRHYTNQLGWGQWIAPAESQDPGTPCPLNPHNIICYPADRDREGPNPEDYPEVIDCTWPEGDPRLFNCIDGWCGEDEYTVFGTFEGGMGFWPYTTGHSGVKLMTPASVSGYYDKFAGQYVLGLNQPVR